MKISTIVKGQRISLLEAQKDEKARDAIRYIKMSAEVANLSEMESESLTVIVSSYEKGCSIVVEGSESALSLMQDSMPKIKKKLNETKGA